MKRQAIAFALLALSLSFAGCRSRTDRSSGTVILSVSNFDQLPVQVSVATGPFQIPSLTLQNVPKDPTGTTSDLQTIELRSYQVTYTRRDAGHRNPPPLVQGIFGNVPVGSNFTLSNAVFLSLDQTGNPPLSDLTRFGRDTETGSAVVVLDVTMQFFGRTLAGDDVASAPVTFTIEVRP